MLQKGQKYVCNDNSAAKWNLISFILKLVIKRSFQKIIYAFEVNKKKKTELPLQEVKCPYSCKAQKKRKNSIPKFKNLTTYLTLRKN